MTLDLCGLLLPDQLDHVDRATAESPAEFLRTDADVTPQLSTADRTLASGMTCGDLRGPGRARTDDNRGVNAVLYQLSYRPKTATTAVLKLLRPPTRTAP